jgi:hypothetical protein
MKDRNNLLTSMIVALLAGVVYYLAGADSIKKILPEITYLDNKRGIEIVYSKAPKPEEVKESIEKVKWTPKKKYVKESVIENPVFLDEEREMASSSDVANLKFDDVIALLDPETQKVELSRLDKIETEGLKAGNELIETPALAWTDGENSKNLKVKIQTKTPVIYAKAKAAIFIEEVLERRSNKKISSSEKNTSNDKVCEVNTNVNTTVKNAFVISNTKAPKVPIINKEVEVVETPEIPGYNVIWDVKNVKNNIKTEVKTTSMGYNFIMIQSDDKDDSSCKTKCNK